LRLQARAYRAHDPRWSSAPISGAGAAISGGRFNATGTPALYLSLDPITALAECTQGFAARMLPLTLCEYDVDCGPVADLTNAAGCAAHGVDPADLGCAWLTIQRSGKIAPSQRVAAALAVAGQVGALVQSFVPGVAASAANLVLWRWSDSLPVRVMVHDPDGRLPRGDASWR
jgi:RES domain-containing protein